MIETEHLSLRPHAPSDFEPWYAMMADPVLLRVVARPELSREDAWNQLLRHAGHWSWFGYGNLAIFDKKDSRFLGEVGLFESHRDLGAGFDGCTETAWILNRSAQGRGLAVEAVSAALEWIEQVHGTERTVCLINSENLSSFRVADKLGYRPFRSCVYKTVAHTILERPRKQVDQSI